MQEEALDILRKNLNGLLAKVELKIYNKKDDPLSQNLKEFAQAVSEAAGGKITVTEEQGNSYLPVLPTLTLSSKHSRNIYYSALPEGFELHPFIQALHFIAQGYAPISEKTKELLAKVVKPAEIWVFVSPHCTHCPKVVETVMRLTFANALVSAYIIDVVYFKELAHAYGIKSVPATIIDRELVLIGHIGEEKLSALLAQRGMQGYDRELIRSLLESGLTKKAADVLCKGKGREVILSLFKEGDFFTRMGILVVFEEALENNPGTLREMIPQLIELLSHEDHRIRGDIADLLGKIGDPKAIPHLEKLAFDPHPDVVEASSEALEMLRGF